MIWLDDKPQPLPTNIQDRQQEIKEATALLDNQNKLVYQGPKKSGKTFCLQNYLKTKQPQEKALVLITWATERQRWKNFLEEKGIENTIVHTPDSLALYLINNWSRNKNKSLEWVNEPQEYEEYQNYGEYEEYGPHKVKDTIKSDKRSMPKPWMDSSSYAKTMLSKNKISIGVAHWLLQQEIDSFILNSMVPKVELLCLDEPHQWEEEAYSWISHIPYSKKIETKQSALLVKEPIGNHHVDLKGWISNDKKVFNKRWLTIQPQNPLNWKDYTVISQHISKLEKKICKRRGTPMKTVEQTRGRLFKKIWIDSLPSNVNEKRFWGDKYSAQEKLDTVCSAASEGGYSKMNYQDFSSLLPQLKISKERELSKYLVWDI